jgi:hypothetical protein
VGTVTTILEESGSADCFRCFIFSVSKDCKQGRLSIKNDSSDIDRITSNSCVSD